MDEIEIDTENTKDTEDKEESSAQSDKTQTNKNIKTDKKSCCTIS